MDNLNFTSKELGVERAQVEEFFGDTERWLAPLQFNLYIPFLNGLSLAVIHHESRLLFTFNILTFRYRVKNNIEKMAVLFINYVMYGLLLLHLCFNSQIFCICTL